MIKDRFHCRLGNFEISRTSIKSLDMGLLVRALELIAGEEPELIVGEAME